jgi:hypothetical protein
MWVSGCLFLFCSTSKKKTYIYIYIFSVYVTFRQKLTGGLENVWTFRECIQNFRDNIFRFMTSMTSTYLFLLTLSSSLLPTPDTIGIGIPLTFCISICLYLYLFVHHILHLNGINYSFHSLYSNDSLEFDRSISCFRHVLTRETRKYIACNSCLERDLIQKSLWSLWKLINNSIPIFPK